MSIFVASDFDDTSIMVNIMPGDTEAIVSIPIINDRILEGPESFDVVLTPKSIGVVVGTPGQTEVTINNDDGESLNVIMWIVL